MKKHSVLAATILALLLSLAVIVPAGAIDGIGFDVDCEKAVGYGWVPAGTGVGWDIALYDPAISDWWYFGGWT